MRSNLFLLTYSMSTNKSKNKKASSTESLIQLSQTELENMVQGMVANAIKPLEEEIKALKTEVDALRQSQQFICNQNDDQNKSYKSALLSTKQQKQSITELNKRTDVLMKQSCEDEIKKMALGGPKACFPGKFLKI